MKKTYLYFSIFCFFLTPILLNAQSNLQSLAPNPAFNTDATFLNPAYLKNNNGFQLNLFPFASFNMNVSNNFVSFGNLFDIATEKKGSDNFSSLHAILDNLKSRNQISLQTNYTLFNAGFSVGNKKSPFNISLSANLRTSSNFTTNGDFFRLMIQGNKQFAGQTVNLNPHLSFLLYGDLGAAISKTIQIGDFSVTPAVRFRYLVGLEALYVKNSKLSLYTEENGDYLELEAALEGYAGGFISPQEIIKEDDNINYDKSFKDAWNSRGRGFAMDFGAVVAYKNMSLGLGMIDNGFIHFNDKNGGRFFTNNSKVRWEGADIFASEGGGVNFSEGDNLLDSLKLKSSSEAFNAGLGSKISLNFNYGIIAKSTSKGENYYMNNFGLSILQGFKNRFNSKTDANFMLYYQLNLENMFSVGVNYNKLSNIHDIGANIGLNVAHMKIGIGSNSLSPLFSTFSSRQADIFMNFGFYFGGKKKVKSPTETERGDEPNEYSSLYFSK